MEDHDRIAEDLHDHVIQELFALGMALQGHAARTDPATAERINGYVDRARTRPWPTISISLTQQDGLITLGITDNGRGLGMHSRSSGLASTHRRATRNGGTFQVATPAAGGSRLTWTASVP